MPAARTPATTRIEEFLRQSDRIMEQLDRLDYILDTIMGHLEYAESAMRDINPTLSSNITEFRNALGSYQIKSREIFSNISAGMKNYANNLQQSTDTLSDNISKISSQVESL